MNGKARYDRAALKQLLAERILVLDGAMGTEIQKRNLTAADFGGEMYEGCNDLLVRTRPDVITDIHRAYLEAGADIIETNSFGTTPIVLAEYGMADQARELSRLAAELARRTADRFGNRIVAGSMGPTTKAISVTGGVTFGELVESFRIQALGLLEGGADYLLIETAQDTRNVKAAILGAQAANRELGADVPVALSCTIESTGTMLAGQGIEAFYLSVEHADPLYVGLNCATGPDFMTDHVRSLAALARCGVSCVPNAGLPDENGVYRETPDDLASKLGRFMDQGWVNVIGGCCGTSPAHIAAMARVARGRKPRVPVAERAIAVSGVDPVFLADEERPFYVGERTNVIGSRAFKKLIREGNWIEAAEIGRRQVRKGAHIIDVCLADPEGDEKAAMVQFLDALVRKIRAPLMIDSTDAAVVEPALTYSQGKAIINSINLEEGKKRFDEIVPLARKYGAAVVVGLIDEDPENGMAVTLERKIAIAERSFALLTAEYGFAAEDIIFDPLTFPVGTGDQKYVGSARATIEGLRALKNRYPRSRTVLGVSNVSFGLPPAGREVLNSVFLHHCIEAGLDLAIVNTEMLVRYAVIPDEEKRLADAILFNGDSASIVAFSQRFQGREKAAQRPAADRTALPLDERLVRAVVEGSREGLAEDLAEALRSMKPIEIINGPLMRGMDQVGKLFGENKLIVAEVLESAEVMKAAVTHLESHMPKGGSASKGTMVLATVKGDVHDIGKNLVEIIFSNNGYRVVDLGIKCSSEKLIAAAREEKADLIGLSGLLVRSAQQMAATAADLKAAGIATPIMVGGAALSEKFAAMKIAPAYDGPVSYAKSAMDGLSVANDLRAGKVPARAVAASVPEPPKVVVTRRSARVEVDYAPPVPTDLKRHALVNLDAAEVKRYVNPQMLLGKHLGMKGVVEKLLAQGDTDAVKLQTVIDELYATCGVEVSAVHQFFRARSDGNRLFIGETVLELPRQAQPEGLCLADYVRPHGDDFIGLFVVTAGKGIREQAEAFKRKGEYLKSVALQALALEMAEAAAEHVHRRMRAAWGFADPADLAVAEILKAHYRGKRYSFGYPACPELSDQKKLFALLRPEEIGVALTEGDMMEPEASVSALVFHHPQAVYFSVE